MILCKVCGQGPLTPAPEGWDSNDTHFNRCMPQDKRDKHFDKVMTQRGFTRLGEWDGTRHHHMITECNRLQIPVKPGPAPTRIRESWIPSWVAAVYGVGLLRFAIKPTAGVVLEQIAGNPEQLATIARLNERANVTMALGTSAEDAAKARDEAIVAQIAEWYGDA